MDFTTDDAPIFPMYVEKGGTLYGFCPGKATWDPEASAIVQALVVTAETGIMLEEGPLSQQPDWWIDLLSWFLPYYSDQKFYSRARTILGNGKETSSGGNGRRAGPKNNIAKRKDR